MDASIVKDKVSGRSKGVAYVEFSDSKAVSKAIEMTGEKLLGIPIIVQLTESEKNRQDLEQGNFGEGSNGLVRRGLRGHEGPVENRIYAGNIHFGVTENELRQIFESFGAIETVTLQREANGKSKGYAFIQYVLLSMLLKDTYYFTNSFFLDSKIKLLPIWLLRV